MLKPPPLRSRSGSRDGIALVMALAFVLLLTILIISFIAFTKLNRLSTTSYSQSIQAQEVALGGLQDILGDLRQEMIAGSIPDPGSVYTQSGVSVYVPSTNLTMIPARLGYPNGTPSAPSNDWLYWPSGAQVTGPTAAPATFLPSLVRVSRASEDNNPLDLYPPLNSSTYSNLSALPGGTILNRASPASTGTASLNGRYISPARWNKPYLLASSTTLLPKPFYTSGTTLPEPSYPTTPDLPDWVYVTRAGSRVCANTPTELASLKESSNVTQSLTVTAGSNPPASPVIGRYAFVMYDEGALLDATVAGSPSQLIKINNSTYSGYAPVVATQSPASIVNYVSTTAPQSNLAFTGKSYAAFADISQLPGLMGTAGHSGNGTGPQTTIDNLIDWRNGSAATTAGGALTGVNYLNAVYNYGLGRFLTFQNNATTGVSDSPFLSRQDLINYFSKIDTNINTTTPSKATYSQALPYLGTFSRAVSAPSYTPPSDSSTLGGGSNSIYAYKTNAETSTASPFSSVSPNPNRDLANVRFANAGAITHYSDDATVAAQTYNVNVGDPLLQNRFSLAKINWLSQVSPQPSDGKTSLPSSYATAIQACFGLTWGVVGPIANGGNACWKYVGSPAGSSGHLAAFNGTIETLDQVANEGREPNFFELLKAAILQGSIGLNPGQAGWVNGTSGGQYGAIGSFRGGNYMGGIESYDGYSFDRAATIPAPACIPDIQIIKIGANIIDQYDTDSYPTAIYFHYSYLHNGALVSLPANYDAANFTPYTASSGLGDLNGPSDMVYGDENLPLLHGVYGLIGTDTATTTNDIEGWWQPEIWNPHQEPNAGILTAAQQNSIPGSFKIKAYGVGYIYWSQEGTGAAGAASGTTTSTQLDNDYITFTDSSPTTSAFYASPVGLGNQLSGITAAGNGTDAAKMTAPGFVDYSSDEFVGFWLGNDSTFVFNPDPYEVYTEMRNGTGITVCLGWTDSAGGFHPYSYLPQYFGYTDCILGQEKNDTEHGEGYPYGKGDAEWHVFMDPRTSRFATLAGWQAQNYDTTFFSGVNTYPNSDTYGQAIPIAGNFVYPGLAYGTSAYETGWEANALSPPSSTGLINPAYYSDPDGVIRPADGINGNSTSLDGLFLFTQPANNASGSPFATGDSGGNVQHARRPVILNRPFRSVGELGYVFRDLPFKTLDFFSPTSADAALLDVFSLTDESKVTASTSPISSVIAGQVSLSNAPLPVVEALLSGGAKKEIDPTYNLGVEGSQAQFMEKLAKNIASQLNSTTGPSPLRSRADLVTQVISSLLPNAANGYTSNTYTSGTVDYGNKAYFEAPVRALSSVTNTRTWNLMIDIIAQSGQIASTATTLDNFLVQGEKRYWLHVSIDRYTGKVVAQQLEPVYE